MKNYYKWYIYIALLGCVLQACRKADEYKKYMEGGEIIYPAKADSVKAYSGKSRVMLSWIKTDPRITQYRIFWNLGTDSLELEVSPTGEATSPDTIQVIVPELEEADYEFSIVSYDEDNNRSIPSIATGVVYGDNYNSTLLNRVIKSISVLSGTDFAGIEWYDADSTEAGIEIIYRNQQNAERRMVVSKDSIYTKLIDYKTGTSFSYRTMFLPDENAIDTFYTEYLTVEAPPISYPELDKSKFREFVLPGDVGSAWGWIMPFLWDGNTAEGSGFHTPEVNLPQHFTFDLGVEARLHEVKVWQRQGDGLIYNAGNFKRFEIWGSNDPAADGSFTGWTKLLECTSVKPSGSPLGTVTEEDVAYASAGELFTFPEETPAVKYIRFKMLENWSGSLSNHIMEATFWGEY